MNHLRQIGGFAALLEALVYVTIVGFVFLILPGQGLSGPDALQDPFKVLPVVARSPALAIFNLHSIAVAVVLLPVVLAVHEHLLQDGARAIPLATTAGIGAAVLFLLTGMVDFVSLSQLARATPQDQTEAATAFMAVTALRAAIGYAAIFSYGVWLLLVNGVGLRGGALPQPLAWIGLVFGLMGLLAFVITPLAFIGPLVGIVWNFGLGAMLLRKDSISQKRSAMGQA